jgi:CRISPR-associated protein Cas1
MKRHLNTLYVTTQGAYLATKGETVVVRADQEDKLRVPFHMLDGIVCFGRVGCSPELMGRCADRGVGISFLTERGRFMARVQGPVSGNVMLRREQYRRADDLDASADLARAVVIAKVANCRSVLQRAARDHPDSPGADELRCMTQSLARNLADLDQAIPLNVVRGVEGDAARVYFQAFDHLIVHQKDGFSFNGRSRRPPMDSVNAMLSFAYTLLVHDVSSALEAVGLDPQVGFLHRDRPGRPGLALDLMEEFRPFLADRLVLSLINRRQVRPTGFETRETGGVIMNDPTRKAFLVAYQERKQEEIRHPFLDEKTTVGMLVHLQAQLLSRHLRGDLDAYPAFVWKA